ncbi:MAG: hypothetical protein WCT14_14525 [Treponemataceae bacterium]
MIFTTGNLLTLGIVLVALVLFRQLDRNNRSMEKLRKYGERLRDDLSAFVAEREAAVKDYAVELDVQRKSAKELLNRLSSVEEGFATRADGIVKIDERLAAYDKSLEELLRMTARAQENLERLKDESTFTDGVLKKVKEAKDQLLSVEKGLGEIELRFERENAEALERTSETAVAAVKATASDLLETAETIERRVEDHRDAIVAIEKHRGEQLAVDAATIKQVVQDSLRLAREEADKLEDAAFAKLKDQALERSRRFQEAVEEKLGQFQEASKARLTDVQTLVKTFKSDWQQSAVELSDRQKAYRDEWKKDAAELFAVAKAGKEDWKKEAQDVRAALEVFKAAVKTEGSALVAEAGAAAKAAADALMIESGTSIKELRADFESIREESEQNEQAAAARTDAVRAAVEKIEMDFKRRAAALEEATKRVEEHALASAGEDAARRQGEIRAAVETSIAAVSDRLISETTRVEQGIRAVETSAAALSEQLDTFVRDFTARLSAAAEDAERKALAETDLRLEAYRSSSIARFERLETLADDVGRMDAELRRSMGDTEARVREDFSLFEKEAENARTALRADMDGVEKELATLKTRAYENVSEKLKMFEDDFFADLSKRSDEIDRRLTEWKSGVDVSLSDLASSAAAERARLEAAFVEELKAKLSEQSERSMADLERLKEQTAAFEEGIREQTSGADISVQAFKEQMLRDLEEARASAAAATKAEIGKHSLSMAEQLKKDQRGLEESLKTLITSVEERKTETSERLEASRRDLEAWQASVTRQLRDADGAVEEARRRARELAAESDERLSAVRTAIQESRDEASTYRTELLARTDEQVKTIDASVKDVDRRLKEFLSQTKLFERADELKVELERRVEDLGADLDRLDQRRSEAAELEAQFVKIKRLEDEVNAKMTRFLSEKRRIELMEADFKRLLQTAQSVDDKLAQVTSSDDTLQNLQAQLRRLDDAAKEADQKIERIEKKGQVLDATAEGIDRNFQALREADASAKRIEDELKKASATAASVRDLVEKIAVDKDKADDAIDKISSLDKILSDIEDRIESMQKAREWLARTETRLAEVSKQAQDQVKIMGTLLKAEGGKATGKDRGAPPIGVRETVVKLAHQGWSIDEIARAVKLSKGEVELILEISPKG